MYTHLTFPVVLFNPILPGSLTLFHPVVLNLFYPVVLTLFYAVVLTLFYLLVLTLSYPAVGGIFDQTDGGWEECQKPDADPVNLKITIRCLAPPPALIVEWKGKIKDRWGARFCKYTSF